MKIEKALEGLLEAVYELNRNDMDKMREDMKDILDYEEVQELLNEFEQSHKEEGEKIKNELNKLTKEELLDRVNLKLKQLANQIDESPIEHEDIDDWLPYLTVSTSKRRIHNE